ncbi:MAG: DUF1343 domain-containing protein [Bacteroidales bacterium]|nr:DUF1343 domain-containing protein [Bacteroidales bacterium]
MSRRFLPVLPARLALSVCLLLLSLSLSASVKPGIEVLRERNFDLLEGKRVGLVTNPSGVDRQLKSTIDILRDAPNVNLVALYGPEHGVRGDVWAGGKIEDSVDKQTGLPVFSLYGATRKPTPQMLQGIDVMVYDIQDVGTRSYTFISTLGLVMRTCGELGIEVVVLDRPNPLSGLKVEGCCVQEGFFSFVSQYEIPYLYGLTVGELAVLINEEGLNRDQKGDQPPVKCTLTVVPMEGWSRDMLYADTGLPWVLPSPNIPTADAAKAYPASGLCGELYGFVQVGIGYTLPFGVFAAEWIDADALKARLDSLSLPGTAFRTIQYRPMTGSSAGKLIYGVQFFFTDFQAARVTLTQFYVMQALAELYPDRKAFTPARRVGLFDKCCGTDQVRERFGQRHRVEDIEALWMGDVEAFRKASSRYWLYR